MSFPWDLSPRFARYYRDPHGVEFRDLMKAYGIRFDVIVNGKVCGSSSLSTAWWLPGQGDWRAPRGSGLSTLPYLSVCLTGGKIQHHPHSHQHWFWAGAHGCCEYLPYLTGSLGTGKSLTAWQKHAEPQNPGGLWGHRDKGDFTQCGLPPRALTACSPGCELQWSVAHRWIIL